MKMRVKTFVFLAAGICFFLGSPVHAQIVDKIVAVVNEDIITLVDIQKGSAPYLKKIMSSQESQERKDELIKTLNEDMLNRMIEQTLTQQEAKRYGISITEKEIDAAVENIKDRRSLSQEEFVQALGYEGLSLDDFRSNLEKQILQSKIITMAVKSKVVITQSDIKAYYNANSDKYAGTKKHHLKNILMQDLDQITAVKKQLDKKQSFAVLAKEYSMAANAEDGGDLGLFDISNFSSEIKDSISTLKKGAYTDVIETAQGYQIFYLQDIVIDGSKSLDQASGEIEEILYMEQVNEKFESWLKTLKENAHIKKML